jgi:transcription initiation factor IIE alpha subunit
MSEVSTMLDMKLVDQRKEIAHEIEALEETLQMARQAAREQLARRMRLLTKKLQDLDLDITNESSMDAGSE